MTESNGVPKGRVSGEPALPAASRAVGPEMTTRVLLILFLTGICSRGYGFYNQQWKSDPSVWTNVLHGTSAAPEQYRVGVMMTANWIAQIFHLRLSQAFGILDLTGSLIGILLLYRLLERTPQFRRSSLALQWFGSAAFLALTIYYVDWTNWYQRPTTLPTTCLVAVMLWVWTPRPGSGASKLRRLLLAAGFFLLAMAQAFVRADVALIICLGIFLVSLTRIGGNLAISRSAALTASFVTAVAVAAVQLYLMRVRYPHASYDGVPVFMLKHDFVQVFMWASCLIFLAPFLWTVAQVVQRRFAFAAAGAASGAELAFMTASIGYLGMWLTLGRLDEVRIFIPMALVNLPLTVRLAMDRVRALEHG